jgi:ribosome biogenesis GTPase
MPEMHTAELSGKLAHHSNRDAAPKVGDWVAARSSDDERMIIEAIIPRKNELARKVAGTRTIKQVIAANIDIAFVLLALDSDFSVERLNRYLYQLSANHIEPIIVLNKADKANKIDTYVEQLNSLKIPILVTSATKGVGIDQIIERINPGSTAILLGSSGVGKSTLTNLLLGTNTQHTQEVRSSDSTGKHTTVHREIFVLPNGGLLIDTPGIRELQLWGTEENLDENFDDIATLIKQCRYHNCQHRSGGGCAIRDALNAGQLSPTHWENYQKMKLELVSLRAKSQTRTQIDNKKSHKSTKRRAATELKEFRDEINGK